MASRASSPLAGSNPSNLVAEPVSGAPVPSDPNASPSGVQLRDQTSDDDVSPASPRPGLPSTPLLSFNSPFTKPEAIGSSHSEKALESLHSFTFKSATIMPVGDEDEKTASLPADGGADADISPQLSTQSSRSSQPTTSAQPAQRLQRKPLPSESSSVDIASKTSTHSSERSGSADSGSRKSRSQSSLLPPQTVSRRSTSPAGRIKGIFRSKTKKSDSSSPRSSSPDRAQTSTTEDPSSEHDSQASADPHQPTIERPLPVASPRPSTAKPPSSSPRKPRLQPMVDTTTRPLTPPTSDVTVPGPTIVNTPPTPTDTSHSKPRIPQTRKQISASETGSPPTRAKSNASSANGVNTHRRLRSGSGGAGPSKLSNFTLPLSPTPEHSSPNSGGPLTPSSGFFSSVISAAQNAATTFSNSIQNTNIVPGGGNKGPKTSPSGQTGQPHQQLDAPDDGLEVKSLAREMPEDQIPEKKEPAVKTLGAGDLSLSQLGLSDPSLEEAQPPSAISQSQKETMSRARSESTPVAPSPSLAFAPSNTHRADDDSTTSKSQSLYEQSMTADEKTPPPSSFNDDKSGASGVHRSGSVRSALSRRRKRGSSAATGFSGNTDRTGTTIGAGIISANASFANPRGGQSLQRVPGFAVAGKKRNRDFHSLFKSVPDDDYLIEDYSCALQREILAHGRLYVSEGHLCFSSNILGWVTTLVLSFDEIVSVEKRSTALVFRNGLMISTLHNKHVFASFANRDSTYDLIIRIWQLGHSELQSSLNGVPLSGPGGDKTERLEEDGRVMTAGAEQEDGQSESGLDDEAEESDDDIYDEDEAAEMLDSSVVADGGAGGTDGTDGEKGGVRKVSGVAAANGAAAEQDGAANGSGGSADFPGPLTHAPTDCGDAATHYDKIVGDDVVPAPLGKVFSLLFGAQSAAWVGRFLTENQKCMELQMEDKRGLGTDNTSRTFSYVKPLSGGIGPKQTRCIVSENVDAIDWDKAVNLNITTQNPDVPNGNMFCVKTKYCLSWAENNKTRVQVNCTIEWSGKSWIKGPIENGAREGQTAYCRDLFAALKATLEARPAAAATGTAQKAGKKKGKKARAQQPDRAMDAELSKPAARRDWGLAEPIRPVLEPLVDIVSPVLTGNVVYGLLVGLLVAAWFGFGFNASSRGGVGRAGVGFDDRGPYGYPDRVAAYEEMWRREEGELWEWLEERVGLHRLAGEGDGESVRGSFPRGGKVGVGGAGRSIQEKMKGGGMEAREVEEAIRVTEEKLRALKDMVGKKAEEVVT